MVDYKQKEHIILLDIQNLRITMTITSKNKHDACEVFVDCTRTNSHGRPALCCANHIVHKGRHAGLPEMVQWISDEDFQFLYNNTDTKFVGDVVPFLNWSAKIIDNTHFHSVRQGREEPECGFSHTMHRPSPGWR